MITRVWLLIVVCLILITLTSCSIVGYSDTKPSKEEATKIIEELERLAASSKPTASSREMETIKIGSSSRIVVRTVLSSDDVVPMDSFSFIYLNSRPVTKASRASYIELCQAWQSLFNDRVEIIDQLHALSYLEVHNLYWLAKDPLPSSSQCSKLIDNYDYGRAIVLALKLGINPNHRQIVTKVDNEILTMDLSSLSDKDYEHALSVWQEKVCKPIVKSKEIKLYSLLDSLKITLGTLAKAVKLQ